MVSLIVMEAIASDAILNELEASGEKAGSFCGRRSEGTWMDRCSGRV
jgi:hypothetical protein